MVLQNRELDESDDDHSYELIDSDDLHTDKSDHTDNESFEIIGSEELNSGSKDLEEVNIAGNISEGNDFNILDVESADTSKSDEQQLVDTDRYSHKSTDSELSFSDGSTYSWDALPINEMDDKDEQQLVDTDRYSHKSTDSELSFSDGSTYSWDALPINEMDDKHQRFKRRALMSEMMTYIEKAHELPPNIVMTKDMKIKDVAKDHILPFLPAKSLLRFRTVSKDWDNWIAHPFLAHLQSYHFQDMSGFFCQNGVNHFFVALDQSAYGIPDHDLSFLPRMVKIKSSSNGLLLCQGVGDQDDENEYYVCNPANKRYHVLPRSGYYHGSEPNFVLAFEPSSLNCGEDYKVICAFDIYNGPPVLCFDIYSSETRSWTCSNAVCSEVGAPYLEDNGLYQNGVAFWATSTAELLAFDTINDICGVQPICSDIKARGILTLMDGELSYVQSYIEPSCLKTDMQNGIWDDETEDLQNKCIIEIFGGVSMCLKRRDVFNINVKIYDKRAFRVLFAVKSNFFIFSIDNMLYFCDVKKEKFDVIRGRISSSTTYIPYVNSLVSLP